MDEIQTDPIRQIHDAVDTNLPAVVASFKMLTVDTNVSPSENKRIIKRRIPKDESNENLNRRCSLRPRKRTCSEIKDNSCTEDTQKVEKCDMKKYYLNRSLKRRLNNLETIYEEKDDTNECITYMSVKRYKRMIKFEEPTDSKLKKRRAKIKRIFGSKINFKRRYASMQMLLDKLSGIRAESPTKADSETK